MKIWKQRKQKQRIPRSEKIFCLKMQFVAKPQEGPVVLKTTVEAINFQFLVTPAPANLDPWVSKALASILKKEDQRKKYVFVLAGIKF